MNPRLVPALAGGIFSLLLVAAAPPAVAPSARPGPTAAQRAQFQALTERLGACHRAQAIAMAATKAAADQIVARTLTACESRVTPIRTLLARLVGAETAQRMLAAQRGHWREAIRRIVAAERARR